MQEQTGSIAEGPAEETAGSWKTADHFTKQVADNKPAKASNRKGKKENEGGKRKIKHETYVSICTLHKYTYVSLYNVSIAFIPT